MTPQAIARRIQVFLRFIDAQVEGHDIEPGTAAHAQLLLTIEECGELVWQLDEAIQARAASGVVESCH